MHGITDREELELEQLQLAARAKQDIRTMAFNWINAATSTRARMRRLRLAK
jgi:hypothetical protein